jgi:hypothetical protein
VGEGARAQPPANAASVDESRYHSCAIAGVDADTPTTDRRETYVKQGTNPLLRTGHAGMHLGPAFG